MISTVWSSGPKRVIFAASIVEGRGVAIGGLCTRDDGIKICATVQGMVEEHERTGHTYKRIGTIQAQVEASKSSNEAVRRGQMS